MCDNDEQAIQALQDIMKDRVFGDAGEEVVIEEFLKGEEVSFFALVDGITVAPLASAQDHKAVHDGDKGPNTGGMGAYSPAPVVTDLLAKEIMVKIIEPTMKGMIFKGKYALPYFFWSYRKLGNITSCRERPRTNNAFCLPSR